MFKEEKRFKLNNPDRPNLYEPEKAEPEEALECAERLPEKAEMLEKAVKGGEKNKRAAALEKAAAVGALEKALVKEKKAEQE